MLVDVAKAVRIFNAMVESARAMIQSTGPRALGTSGTASDPEVAEACARRSRRCDLPIQLGIFAKSEAVQMAGDHFSGFVQFRLIWCCDAQVETGLISTKVALPEGQLDPSEAGLM
jgi:hypothetical protein